MLLGRYVISDHAIDQYEDRLHVQRKDVIKSIKRDLRTMNIKNIVYAKEIHVFTKGNKEFIFARGRKKLILKTVIKRNKYDHEKRIKTRKNLVTN